MPRHRYHPKTGDRVELDGAKLRELRASQGLTLSDVARRADVSVAVVSQWEHEAAVPGVDGLAGLRRVFGDALAASGAVVVVEVTL